MKKTIITLLALGGIAIAAEPPSYSITLGDATTTSISTGSQKIWLNGEWDAYAQNFNNGWMMDFSITSHTLTMDGKQIIFKAQGSDGGLEIAVHGDNTIALTDWNGDVAITSTVALTTGTVYRAAYDKTAQSVYLINTETNEYESGTWTSENYGAIGTYAATFYTGDSVTINVGDAFDMDGITGDAFKTSMTTTPATPAVPEPATATLSLLALAGLAARRRRR